MEYHGINVMALWAQAYLSGYRSGYWASYKQWEAVGAQVMKGQKGSTVVFYKQIEGDADDGEDGEPSIRLVARASRVFNADQVVGWEPPAPPQTNGGADVIDLVEAFVAATKAEIRDNDSMACYHIRDDYIEMPSRSRFIGSPTSSATEARASTILHELVHWSGAKHRLDRGFGDGFTKESRAAEELVAEIGAAFLCADLGVTNEARPDHAAYVANWLTLLKNDSRAIFRASKTANHATMYLHELASAGAH
jgi:antirestriction protein ArdC